MKKQHSGSFASRGKPHGGERRPYSGKTPYGGKPRFDPRRPDKRNSEKRVAEDQDTKPSFGDKSHHESGKPRFDKRPFEKRPFGKRPDRRNTEKRISEKRKIEKPDSVNTGHGRDTVMIWGFHAARAAWLNPKRKCFRLWLSEAGQKTFEATIAEARDALLKRPDARLSERHDMERLTPPNSVHQGIVVEVGPLHEPTLHELIAGDNPPDCLVMLDQVTDPHNIGAIMRSAAALGAGGVILTERNAPGMTGVLAKSASGAADHIPQVHVVNLSRALDELREAGYWSVGLAEDGEKNLDTCDLSGRTVLVLGAEGEGLRQLTRKKCDELARLPTGGALGSLNVSNAAAVALYEAKRQKTRA